MLNHDDNDRTESQTSGKLPNKLEHYQILGELGEGGMGRVLLAEDTRLQRRVAIKLLSSHLAAQIGFRERFLREARIAAQLMHPNICTIHGIEGSGDNVFIVMEFVQGQTLRTLLRASLLPLDKIYKILEQCCDALQVAHAAQIVHRDIKSSNIMLDATGRVKILDFGLARQLSGPEATQSGEMIGTLQYMSPEQISGKPIDHRSDLFSLGVVAFELLTSKHPFQGNDFPSLAHAISTLPPPPIIQYRPDAPLQVQAIVNRLLCKDREHRYQQASEVARDLSNVELTAFRPAANVEVSEATGPISYGPSSATSNILSVAVVPFTVLGELENQAYLSEGFCEEIISKIAQLRRIRVVSRSAVLRLTQGDYDPVDVATKLGVSHYVEGTILRSNEHIRISVELIQARDSQVVWASQFARGTEEVLLIQEEIAQSVCSALGMQLSSLSASLSHVARIMPQAYDAYLRGKFQAKKRSRESLEKAIALFTEAIDLDGGFAPPYAALAQVYTMYHYYGHEHDSDLLSRAHALANKALTLDPRSSEAHAALGIILKVCDFSQAINEFRRAVLLDPSSSEAHHYLAHLYMLTGNYRQATEEDVVALSLDPFLAVARAALCHTYYFCGMDQEIQVQLGILEQDSLSPYLLHATNGWLQWCKRDWSSALDRCNLAMSLDTSNVFNRVIVADCCLRLKKLNEARAHLEAVLDNESQYHMIAAKLAQVELAAGRTIRATELTQRAHDTLVQEHRRSLAPDSAIFYYDRAWISALTGELDGAVSDLVKAAERGFRHQADLVTRPDWDSLRQRADFMALVERLS